MQIAERYPLVADEVPWSETLTDYDDAHFAVYMKLLVAAADEENEYEMARAIFGIDPALEPYRAQRIVVSHLERANWIVKSGYKELFAR